MQLEEKRFHKNTKYLDQYIEREKWLAYLNVSCFKESLFRFLSDIIKKTIIWIQRVHDNSVHFLTQNRMVISYSIFRLCLCAKSNTLLLIQPTRDFNLHIYTTPNILLGSIIGFTQCWTNWGDRDFSFIIRVSLEPRSFYAMQESLFFVLFFLLTARSLSSRRAWSRCFVLLLPLHPSVLEPNFDLTFREAHCMRDLDAPPPGQVAVKVELLFQLQGLVACVGLSASFPVRTCEQTWVRTGRRGRLHL